MHADHAKGLTKGALVVGTGTDAAGVLVPGTDGFALVLDATQTAGMKWASQAGGVVLDTSTTPADVTTVTAAPGSSAKASPADHNHKLASHHVRGQFHQDLTAANSFVAQSLDLDRCTSTVTGVSGRGVAVKIVLKPATYTEFDVIINAAGSSMTHHWGAVLDSTLNKVAVSADDTSASISPSTAHSFSFASTPVVVATTALYYFVVVAVGTVPGYLGDTLASAVGAVGWTPRPAMNVQPSSLTDPASCPLAFTYNSSNSSVFVGAK